MFVLKGKGALGTCYELVEYGVPQFEFEVMGAPDPELIEAARFDVMPFPLSDDSVVTKKIDYQSNRYFRALVIHVEDLLSGDIQDREGLAEDIAKYILGIYEA